MSTLSSTGSSLTSGLWDSNRSLCNALCRSTWRRRSAGDEAGRDAGRRLVRDASAIPQVNEQRRLAGRAEEQFEFTTLTILGGVAMAELDEMAALGVDRVVVTPWPGKKVGEVGREGLADIERYAKEVGLS